MQALVLALALSSPTLEDGSLLFLEHSNPVVERYTKADISHVGIVFHDDGQPWVYEATPPRVRRVPLDAYYAELRELNRKRKKKVRLHVLQPKQPYTAPQKKGMVRYLDDQLGRRYSIRNYVRKKTGDGIHCAELAANALQRSGRYDLARCHEISPDVLYRTARPHHATARPVTLTAPQEPRESWCTRSWRAWTNFTSWCGWSCRETWLFCR